MTALLTLLTAIALALLVTKIATIALTHTGLSREAARFQARSAFTGAGFTTAESESVVRHPVRRRIVMLLMLLGNAGFVTVLASLILTFVGSSGFAETLPKAAVLGVGVVLLWLIGTSRLVDRYLSSLIDRALKRYTRLEVTDYASLFHLGGEYRIAQLSVQEEDWLAGKTLGELALNKEGILVLGIERRDGSYVGAPRGSTGIRPGDGLVLYGRGSVLEELDERRRGHAGDLAHHRAIAEQRRVERQEEDDPP